MGKRHHDHHTCPDDQREIIDRLVRSCCDCCECCECECKCEEHFSKEEALETARRLCINVNSPCFDLDQFWMGMNLELEHGSIDPMTNVTNNDPITTGKIVMVHLNLLPDYYTRLEKMRKEGAEYWRKMGLNIKGSM